MLAFVHQFRRMTDPAAARLPADLAVDDYALTFAAVPTRARHDGWSEKRQRDFILALRNFGQVAAAVRAVGCSLQSAYKLRKRLDAAEFAAAWDLALGEARDRACDLAMHLATRGLTIPRFYRGNFIGTVHRIDTRLALAVLNAADRAASVPAKSEK